MLTQLPQLPLPRAASRRRSRCEAPRAAASGTSASELNAAHAIQGSVAFETGAGGLVKCVLTHANGSSAEVHLFGATTTSYKLPSGDEVLFMRPDAKLDGSKPIAGGVPLCFPLFGPPPAGCVARPCGLPLLRHAHTALPAPGWRSTASHARCLGRWYGRQRT